MAAGTGLRLTADDGKIISLAERITSAFSLLGLTFIFTTFIFSPKFRKPINRLMFLSAFGNAIYNVATLIARTGVDAGTNSALCQFQGFVIEMFLLSDLLWCLAMAINVWLTVFKKYDARQLRALEWKYGLVNYGVPFVISLVLVFIETEERGKVYGDALLWCWISAKWDWLRVAILYGPAWVLILIITTIYVAAGKEIFNKRRQLRDFSASNSSQRRSKQQEVSFKTTEVQVSTELADIRSPTSPTSNATPSDIEGVEHNPGYKQYDITIGRGDEPDVPSANIDIQLSKPQRKLLNDRNNAAWAYTKCAIMFFVALLITWLPSSINRVYSLVHLEEFNWGLNLAAAIVLPLMGFWNTIIYIFTSWAAVKSLFTDWGPGRTHRSMMQHPSTSRGPSPPWTLIGRGRNKATNDSSDENLTGGLSGYALKRNVSDSILELER